MVNQAFCTLGKVWLTWFENQRSLVVQPGLHPGKPWFNQAFGARERCDAVDWDSAQRCRLFRLRSGLAMWFVHQPLPLLLNHGGLSCFLALLPRSFVLVRCLREANVAIFFFFCERFSWSRQTSFSNGFSGYFHDSTTESYFRSITRQCYSKTKTTTKYCLKHEGILIHVIHNKTKRQRMVCMFHNQMARVFYKCVQLVQGVIMLISITIILRFNFEKKKTSHTSF